MLTREQVLDAIKGGKKSLCMDYRDFERLLDFYELSDWVHFGAEVNENTKHNVIPYSESTVRNLLLRDLDFALEKLNGKRGLSLMLACRVIQMWMCILEDKELQNPSGRSKRFS